MDKLDELQALLEKARSGMEAARHELERLSKDLELARARELHLLDACQIFAERCEAKPEEIAQLGVGTLVLGADDKPAMIVWNTLDDLVTASNFAMKQQATVAKFRQLKQHFVTHQSAVTTMLDQLDKLCSRNVVTRVDVDELRRLRDDLGALIKRKL